MSNRKLSDKYEVKEASKLDPRIKIVGITGKHEVDTMLNLLFSQNRHVFRDHDKISIVNIRRTKKNKDVYQAVIQVHEHSYQLAIEAGNLTLGYDFCAVFDALEVRLCFKCCGFNHTSKCKRTTHSP